MVWSCTEMVVVVGLVVHTTLYQRSDNKTVTSLIIEDRLELSEFDSVFVVDAAVLTARLTCGGKGRHNG